MESFTTLVCLFHHEQQAQAALVDLRNSGIPESSISLIGGNRDSVDALEKSELAQIGMPDRDYDRLKNSIADGGVVVSVSAAPDRVDAVESIFGSHKAEKIDDVERERREEPLTVAASAAPLLA